MRFRIFENINIPNGILMILLIGKRVSKTFVFIARIFIPEYLRVRDPHPQKPQKPLKS